MKCIYEIRYEIQWHSSEPTHWEEQLVRVCSAEDAQEAVERAKEQALKLHRMDENGREERASNFRLREVHLVAEAELSTS